MADRAAVAEGAIEEVAIAPVDRDSGARPLRSEEFGDAKIARRIAESALGLGAFGQSREHLCAVVEPSDGTRRSAQLVGLGIPEGVGAVELVVDEGIAMKSPETEWQFRRLDVTTGHDREPIRFEPRPETGTKPRTEPRPVAPAPQTAPEQGFPTGARPRGPLSAGSRFPFSFAPRVGCSALLGGQYRARTSFSPIGVRPRTAVCRPLRRSTPGSVSEECPPHRAACRRHAPRNRAAHPTR